MKKKWKITIAIVLALVLGAGAYLAYILKFKEYDVADDEVEGIIANPYEVELPDGSKLVIGKDGTVSGLGETVVEEVEASEEVVEASEEAEEEPGKSKQTTSTGNKTANKTAGVTPPKNELKGTTAKKKQSASTTETKKKLTVAEVKGKYEPVFKQLEGQADDKINSLIGRAKKEYIDKKANGESISYGYFYNKYMGAANNLEANTDAAFYGVVKALEAELAANGYNKSHAQSFIDEYESLKKVRRDGILKKAIGS
ncbi:hypothetical protein MHZ92_07530 [Sporosarcina sp. ACRSL]|uniref:hypothetical protein n=1 Tax=Sporosarcina sp. ACRSL TaxID=2918215 RepID=UPI001EF64D7D|nr:hypothetical protein [Sporosarcina sp. ACRSL]MCG7343978.1 hypothetical protein [Sporosarcina sp. ACRSL]